VYIRAMTRKPAARPEDITANLTALRAEIARAARACGRDPASVKLIAVSKFHPVESLLPALHAGQRDFGENRVQEAAQKWPALKDQWRDCVLHLIGPLQTNKVRAALSLFNVIHSLDRENLARRIADEIAASANPAEFFIQVNTGGEPQKSGVSPADADRFITLCRDELGLKIRGLMCIPPARDDPSPHFALLAQIARRNGLTGLSMGMSDDFAAAITHGATHIRVGTAIFGPRHTAD
jgi:PLP dependent protein